MTKGKLIQDTKGRIYAIVGPFLQEAIERDLGRKVSDRVALLYQIGRALRSPRRRIDALYTQASIVLGDEVGTNVNSNVFEVTRNKKDGGVFIGCRHFVGEDAKQLLKAARKAWNEIKK